MGALWGDAGGSRYSNISHITQENVRTLKKTWEYHTGDAERSEEQRRRSANEGTPILVEDSLVFCTPFNKTIALDPASGEEKWRFDPEINLEQRPANQFVCRGVAYWRDAVARDVACISRIFIGTNDGRLVAVDAKTGAACDSFGAGGVVSIDPGMDLLWPGEFQITSPPAVIVGPPTLGVPSGRVSPAARSCVAPILFRQTMTPSARSTPAITPHGGGVQGNPIGDSIVAFALPE